MAYTYKDYRDLCISLTQGKISRGYFSNEVHGFIMWGTDELVKQIAKDTAERPEEKP